MSQGEFEEYESGHKAFAAFFLCGKKETEKIELTYQTSGEDDGDGEFVNRTHEMMAAAAAGMAAALSSGGTGLDGFGLRDGSCSGAEIALKKPVLKRVAVVVLALLAAAILNSLVGGIRVVAGAEAVLLDAAN